MKEIIEAMKKNKLIIGRDRVLKLLKRGKISLVVISSNCNQKFRREIEYYTKIGNVKLKVFEGNNKELGVLCKKPFSISVLGITSGK